MTQYKSLQPINLRWVLWDGPSEYEIRWETKVHAFFVRWLTDSLMFFCAMVKLQSCCLCGRSIHDESDAYGCLTINIWSISSNPTMTIPFCKKMTRGEWTVCQCLMAAGYVTVCLFAPFPNARWCGTWIAWNISWIAHGISEFPLKSGSSCRFSPTKPQRKWGFHHGPQGSTRLPRWLPGQWGKRPQGPKSTTFPGRQGLEVVNSHGYDLSHGATPDHHPSH